MTSLAGLASAANKLPYFSGANTLALADLTPEARGLLSGAGFSRSGSTYTLAGLLAGAAVIQTSLDTTAGRLLSLVSTTGAFGLGGTHGPLLADLDATGIPAGLCFFNTSGGTAGTSPGFAFGAVIVVQGIGSGTQAPMMIAPERSAITNWTFPAGFVANPVVTGDVPTAGVFVQCASRGTSNVSGLRIYATVSTATDTLFNIRAEGRWF